MIIFAISKKHICPDQEIKGTLEILRQGFLLQMGLGRGTGNYPSVLIMN